MDPEQLPLRDLHLPDAIGWWPLATGWWILLGLAFAMLLVWTWLWLKKRKRDAARRYAMRELDAYVADFRRDGDAIRFETVYNFEVNALLPGAWCDIHTITDRSAQARQLLHKLQK